MLKIKVLLLSLNFKGPNLYLMSEIRSFAIIFYDSLLPVSIFPFLFESEILFFVFVYAYATNFIKEVSYTIT